MSIIALEGLIFYAHHGHYEEERKLGGKFSVDIYIETDFNKAISSDDLKDAVDYERVYKLIYEEIQHKTKLLESLADRILKRIMNTFPAIKFAKVRVTKYTPPVGGMCEKVFVELESLRK